VEGTCLLSETFKRRIDKFLFIIIEIGYLKLFMQTNIQGKDFITILNLFTPWSRVLLEQLISSNLVKNFLAFYGTPMFITAFTSARHLSLS
jgi:hypothetical protein